ncbi:recombinase A [Mycobacteroides abscessus]|nr:recombinase A [Mycobacteroides abscessus]
MAQAPDREKALELALAQIDKSFGKGSVMRLGDEVRQPISVIPTGSIALDVALGIGGLPRGRVIEIYGPESSGKTTVALHAVANAQRAGGIAAFIDAEHALDPEYAKKLGVDTDSLLVSQPDTGEQALEIADMLVRSGAIDLIVIDSVAALVPRAEIEGEMGDSHVGLQARLMSQALRKMTGALNNSGTTAIFINQLREKIGVMFGSPETTTGGKALKFYSSVRLDVRRIETLKDGTDAVGNRTRVKVVKNKVSPPFKQAEFDILYGKGISKEGSLIDMGGRVIEIYGPESSGKTTVALHAVANAQRAGGIAAFIDAEHALDPEYAKKLGVDTDSLLVSQPDTGEQALEIADMLVRSGAIDLIVIDSVAALVPRAEIEGEMGDSHVGLQARLMSQALRKMTGALNNSGTTAIFINQLREKIGVMFGSPETTTGGKALKFYSSVRLDVRRIETLKDGTDAVGNRTRVKVVKNKVSPPFKQAEFDILYGKGISKEGSLIDMGVEQGFIRKSGSWFTYEGEQLGQGKENARNFLLENVDVANEIEKKIKEKLGIGAVLTDDEVVPAPVDF